MIYKFIFWLFVSTCFFHKAGTETIMTRTFDATGNYQYKAVDTIGSGSRYDSITLYAPTPTNTGSIMSFGLKCTNSAIDTVKTYVNGTLYENKKLTANTIAYSTLAVLRPHALTPNKILIRLRVKSGSNATARIQIYPLYVTQ